MKEMIEKMRCGIELVFCCIVWFMVVLWPVILLIYGIVFGKFIPLVCGLFFSILLVMFSGDKVERR